MIAGIVAQGGMRQSGGLQPPSANLILNSSGETGIAPWTNEYNSPNFTTRVGDIDAGLVNFFFGDYTIVTATRMQAQLINIPSEYLPFSGASHLALSLDYGSGAQDAGRFIVRFYSGVDGSGDVLSNYWSGSLGALVAKLTFSVNIPVPAGAKSFAIIAMCRQLDGAAANVYFRNVSAEIVPSNERCFSIFAWDVPTELGWTVTTGNIVGTTSSSRNNTHSGGFNLPPAWGGAQANLAYYRDIAVPSEAMGIIASGGAEISLTFLNWRVNSSDESRSYVQCLDGSNNVLAVVQDASTPQPWSNSPTIRRLSGAVPAETTKFRVGHQFRRQDGTTNDATVAQFSALLTSSV